MNRLIASVAVENTFFSAGADYDYYVPDSLVSEVRIGSRVRIPFGRANNLRSGIVIKLYYAINSRLKEIRSVDKKTSPLSEEMVSLAVWLKERCFCTTYDCLRQMLPRGIDKIGDKSSRMIRLRENALPSSGLP